MTPKAPELLDRIQEYLSLGGLFNPEMMEHDEVRRLILDCRTYIEYMHLQNAPTFITQSTFVKKP
jgi:hypothetical protein